MSSDEYILYGAEHSFFTLKAVTYLNYKQIPYRFKPATLWVYKRIIEPRTGVRFIPVLLTPDNQLIQDTSEIIDQLEARFPQRPIVPQSPKQKLTALLFEIYADEWFLFPAMHYRWSYLHEHEAYLMQEFGRLAGRALPGFIQRAIGRALAKPFKNSLAPLGINDTTAPAIEAWFESFLQHFETHLAEHDYLLGSRPCLGDFALAGPLTAHLARDPYSRQLMQRLAPRTLQWIARINAKDQAEGAFLANDEVPQTLNPILQHMFAEQWPILVDTALRLPAWLEANALKPYISRAIGEHGFEIGGVSSKRLIFPYAQWMMQRALDAYASLSDAHQAEIKPWLQAVGGVDAMSFQPPCRVERRHNRLMPASEN